MKLYFPAATFQLQYFAPWLWFIIIRFWFYQISPRCICDWCIWLSSLITLRLETSKGFCELGTFKRKGRRPSQTELQTKRFGKHDALNWLFVGSAPTRDLATKVNDCGWHAVTIRRHSQMFIGLEDHQRVVNNAREKQLRVYLHGNHSLYRVDINPLSMRFRVNK